MQCPDFEVLRLAGVKYELGWWADYGTHRAITVFNGPYLRDGYTTYAAVSGEHILGAVVVSKESRRPRVLRSHGILVRPAYRRCGVAALIWDAVLVYENPRVVEISIVSDKGKTLYAALQREYPDIRWDVVDCGDRQLRNLRRPKQ